MLFGVSEKMAGVRKFLSLFVLMWLLFLASSLGMAGDIKVFVNGNDCGLLVDLFIDASEIRVTADKCVESTPPTEPPPPPDNLVDPTCISSGGSLCRYFELPFKNINYTEKIQPGHRDVYHLKIPVSGSFPAPNQNVFLYFSVVDHGAEVSLNMGISKVKGRVELGAGEDGHCYTGPGTELGLSAATDEKGSKCLMDDGHDYYFTLENLDSKIAGDYRFEFKYEWYQ